MPLTGCFGRCLVSSLHLACSEFFIVAPLKHRALDTKFGDTESGVPPQHAAATRGHDMGGTQVCSTNYMQLRTTAGPVAFLQNCQLLN